MDAKIESGIRIAKNTAIAASTLNVVAMVLDNPFNVIDVVLFTACACGIANKSRFAAMAAFSLSIWTVLYKFLELTAIAKDNYLYEDWMAPLTILFLIVYLVFSILLYKGIWATIVYHDRHDTIVPRQPLEIETAESSVPSGDDAYTAAEERKRIQELEQD